MSRKKLFLALSSLTTVLMVPALGRAQICASNADCAAGTTCQGSGVEPTPAPAACPAGAECSSKIAPADLVARTSCQPAPCLVDTDCGGEMLCHVETYSTCTGGGSAPACPPDAPCDVAPTPPPTTTCTETKVSACAYRWQLPCSADADCGADFVCMPTVTGTCSGSGGTPTPSTGGGTSTDVGGTPSTGIAAPRPPSDDGGTTCTTTTSFPGYCQPRVSTCGTDSDCPAKWTCASVEVPVGTTRPADGTTAVDGAADPAGAPRVAANKVCQSPNAFPVKGGVAGDTGVPATPPTTTGGEGAARASAGGGACALAAGAPDSGGSTLALCGVALLGLILRRRPRAGR